MQDILDLFRGEFSPLLEKFAVHDLTLDAAPENTDTAVNRPGVYVFWKEGNGVIKVGKSQSNAKARALDHIRDNTKNGGLEMARLANDPSCHLLLFTVPRDNDLHWILSLEAFFEWKLKPAIPSARTG